MLKKNILLPPVLKEIKNDPIPWQWHAREAWDDPNRLGEQTTYLAGFKTEAAAREYAVIMKNTGRAGF